MGVWIVNPYNKDEINFEGRNQEEIRLSNWVWYDGTISVEVRDSAAGFSECCLTEAELDEMYRLGKEFFLELK